MALTGDLLTSGAIEHCSAEALPGRHAQCALGSRKDKGLPALHPICPVDAVLSPGVPGMDPVKGLCDLDSARTPYYCRQLWERLWPGQKD